MAGLLEGEGYFGFSKNGPKVMLTMTDKDIVLRVQSLISVLGEGYFYSYKDKRFPMSKILYTYGVGGKRAIEIMKFILPYMGERRKQKITEIVQKWNTRPKLLKFKIAEKIRKEYKRGNKTQLELANKYGISHSNIWHIIHRTRRRDG